MKDVISELKKRKIDFNKRLIMKIPTNKSWSEPETKGPFIYENEFGKVILTPVTKFMEVKNISHKTIPEINNVAVSFDVAEQVTLITENRRHSMGIIWDTESGFSKDKNKCSYSIKYSCYNRAAICSITIERFETPGGVSAQEQIEDIAPKITGPLPIY